MVTKTVLKRRYNFIVLKILYEKEQGERKPHNIKPLTLNTHSSRECKMKPFKFEQILIALEITMRKRQVLDTGHVNTSVFISQLMRPILTII